MISRKTVINLLSLPVFVKPWRHALRAYLKRKLLTCGYFCGKEFARFRERMRVYRKAPASFAFPAEAHPLVSIVIPVYNQYHYTRLCLWSILQNTADVPYEVILADDCSTDETRTISERIRNINVVRPEANLRFLRNCNHAARHARGKYVLFLNNDTQVQPDWLKPLLDLIESDDGIGMVGSQLIYPDGLLQEAGGIVFKDASGYNYGWMDLPVKEDCRYVKEVDYVAGAAIMLKRALWEELGGFDERFAPAYYEDTDLAFQIRQKGLKVVYQPESRVVHFEGRSNGTDISSGQKAYQVVNQKKFYDKWKDVLQKDHGTAADLFLARDRSLGRKTLLFVDQNILTYDRDTGSRASFQYVKFFVKHGFNVKFLPLGNAPQDYHLAALQQMGVEVLCLFGSPKDACVDWLRRNGAHVDYVYLNRPDVAAAFLGPLREYTSAKIVYQGHDLHFRRMQRHYELTGSEEALADARKFERIEREVVPQMDVVTYFSEEEIAEVRGWGVEKPLAVLPLYLLDMDRTARAPSYSASRRADILYVGGYRHLPNADAALYLVREIMPTVWRALPEMKVHLVGANPTEEIQALASDRVVVHGAVSDDELERLYAHVRMSVIPLRFGAGVKGKVLESLYHGVPVATTSVGMQGIPACGCVSVKDAAGDLAEEVVRLYADAAALDEMAREARSFIAAHYSENAARMTFSQWMEIG